MLSEGRITKVPCPVLSVAIGTPASLTLSASSVRRGWVLLSLCQAS